MKKRTDPTITLTEEEFHVIRLTKETLIGLSDMCGECERFYGIGFVLTHIATDLDHTVNGIELREEKKQEGGAA